MAETRVPSRPRQVTFAGIAAATTCAVLVLVLFEQMTQVHSIQTRQAVTDALSQPPFKGSGIGIGQALGVLHALVLLSGALAAAGCVLGVFALLRHRGARLGLTVVALLLVVTSLFLTGLLPVIVAAAACVLWTPQARAWFDGRAYERPALSGGEALTRHQRDARPASRATTSSRTSPVDPTWSPPSAPGSGSPAVPSRRRPREVTAALVVTWSCCGLVGLGLVVVMVRALLDKEGLFAQVGHSKAGALLGSTPNAVLSELLVTCVLLLLWTLAVAGLALPAALGAGWARVALVVNAAVVALFSVAVTIAVPVAGLLLLVASVTVVVLLLLPATSAWYAGRRRPPPPSAPPPGGTPPVW